jgi:hypothetical protein
MRTDRIQVIFVSGILIAGLALFGFFVQYKTRRSASSVAGQQARHAQVASSLEAEIVKLRQLQQESNNAAFVTNEALTRERKNLARIQKKLDLLIIQNRSLSDKRKKELADSIELAKVKGALDKAKEDLTVQNVGLQKEVELLRANFDVALKMRSRLAQVQEQMDGLIIQKGKENILGMQLEALMRETEDINQSLKDIRDNRFAAKVPLPQALESSVPEDRKPDKAQLALELKYLEQVNDLKARINILTNENAVMKEKYLMAVNDSAQHRKSLDAGAQKVLSMQARVIEAESAFSQSQTRYQDLERSVASLRERYVANELEKEGLKIKLNQLTRELNDVRGKFLALLGKISDIFQTPGKNISSNERSDLTSIIGVELFPNATDTAR